MSFEELKRNLEWKIKSKRVVDPLDMKNIYKTILLDRHGIYFTPEISEDELENECPNNEPRMKYIYNWAQKKKFNCNCRKSQCNKNYCACKNNQEKCDDKCACEDCHNLL